MRRQFGATWTTANSTTVRPRSTKTSVVRRSFFGPLREIQSRVRRRRETCIGLAPERCCWLLPPEARAEPAPAPEPAAPPLDPPPVPPPPVPDPLPRDPGKAGGGGKDGSVTPGTVGGGGACGGGGTGGTGGTVTVGAVTVGMLSVVGSVIGGGGRSAAADATQPANSPGMKRANWTSRRRSRALTADATHEGAWRIRPLGTCPLFSYVRPMPQSAATCGLPAAYARQEGS
jgi:hypothetical protein